VNRNNDIDVLAGTAARARQDLNSVTSLRPVPELPSPSRRYEGGARGGGLRRLLRSPALAGFAVAVLVLGILVGIRLVGDGGRASPSPSLLLPGDELDGMLLTTATVVDTDMFIYCDPYVSQPGIYTRYCAVPRLRLMIGYGDYDDSQELLEQRWRVERYRLYLDGQEVDLAAFGTKPDTREYDFITHRDVWLRLWAVTVVNPNPGEHTVRYVVEWPAFGDEPAGMTDITWTINVIV
jgi:hypothetical protein